MSEIKDTAALELVPDAVLIADAGGRIVYASRMCQDLLGWTPDELRGELVERLVPRRQAEHPMLRERFVAEPARRPMGVGLELTALHRSGREVAVEIALTPMTLAGAPHVLVAVRDVRDHREVVHKLSLLSVAFDAAANGVVITDRDGLITWVNPAASRMTGYAAHELVGQRPSVLKSGRHDAAFFAGLWATVTAGRVWQGAIVNRRKDGSEYHEEQTIAPVHDRRGDITHFIAIKQDVTQRVQAERALRETRDELAHRVAEVEALHAQLREQAVRDALTGLFNRRYFDETLPRELARARRDGTHLALVAIDLDHFKRVNDRYGHAAGDRLLAELGRILRAQTRAGDVACRYGGEEFVVVLLGATAWEGAQRAEGWRQSFAGARLPEGEAVVAGTLSAGVAEWVVDETGDQLFARADAALYKAKQAGRDRVVRADTPGAPAGPGRRPKG
jgi:diguanylate cyclase (GGDEF)-like protein/PAS domain S-box-containing protein